MSYLYSESRTYFSFKDMVDVYQTKLYLDSFHFE